MDWTLAEARGFEDYCETVTGLTSDVREMLAPDSSYIEALLTSVPQWWHDKWIAEGGIPALVYDHGTKEHLNDGSVYVFAIEGVYNPKSGFFSFVSGGSPITTGPRSHVINGVERHLYDLAIEKIESREITLEIIHSATRDGWKAQTREDFFMSILYTTSFDSRRPVRVKDLYHGILTRALLEEAELVGAVPARVRYVDMEGEIVCHLGIVDALGSFVFINGSNGMEVMAPHEYMASITVLTDEVDRWQTRLVMEGWNYPDERESWLPESSKRSARALRTRNAMKSPT